MADYRCPYGYGWCEVPYKDCPHWQGTFCELDVRQEKMAEYFAGGHLRFVNGEWRDDNGNAIEISRVRHGRWIASHDEFCACSICKYPVYVGWNQTNYCPNCGAKMGKEEP